MTIRHEPHSVLQAINRQVAHYSYHVGQIVFLAKHWKGPSWTTLSIARGQSAAANAAMEAKHKTVEGGSTDRRARRCWHSPVRVCVEL